MDRRGKGFVAALTLVCAGVLATSGSAGAAIQVGQTFVPDETFPSSWTVIQSSGGQYAVPSSGVITSWSYQAPLAGVPQGLKLKVARRLGGNDFRIVGDSGPQNPTPGLLNTYTDVSITVQPGDLLGVYTGSVGTPRMYDGINCDLACSEHEFNGDLAPGFAAAFGGPLEDYVFDISATLEPDCDADGRGDETQDQDVFSCPPAPGVTINKAPDERVKTKKKKIDVTLEFSASEPAATFNCTLDGQQEFKACTSPLTVTVGKGEHTFSVQATDAGGNTGSAAAATWKVKKKKKK